MAALAHSVRVPFARCRKVASFLAYWAELRF